MLEQDLTVCLFVSRYCCFVCCVQNVVNFIQYYSYRV